MARTAPMVHTVFTRKARRETAVQLRCEPRAGEGAAGFIRRRRATPGAERPRESRVVAVLREASRSRPGLLASPARHLRSKEAHGLPDHGNTQVDARHWCRD